MKADVKVEVGNADKDNAPEFRELTVDTPLRISTVTNDPCPRAGYRERDLSFREICSAWKAHEVGPAIEGLTPRQIDAVKLAGRGFYPCRFEDAQHQDADHQIDAFELLVLDADHGRKQLEDGSWIVPPKSERDNHPAVDPYRIRNWLIDRKWAGAVYTSYQHATDHPRYRVVVLPDRTISKDEGAMITQVIVAEIQDRYPTFSIDSCSWSSARQFFSPRCPEDRADDALMWTNPTGIPLPVDVYLERAAALGIEVKPKKPKTRAKAGATVEAKGSAEGRNATEAGVDIGDYLPADVIREKLAALPNPPRFPDVASSVEEYRQDPDSRAAWVWVLSAVAAATADEDRDAVYAGVDEWSSRHDSYDPEKTAQTWDSLSRDNLNQITVGSFIALMEANGLWTPGDETGHRVRVAQGEFEQVEAPPAPETDFDALYREIVASHRTAAALRFHRVQEACAERPKDPDIKERLELLDKIKRGPPGLDLETCRAVEWALAEIGIREPWRKTAQGLIDACDGLMKAGLLDVVLRGELDPVGLDRRMGECLKAADVSKSVFKQHVCKPLWERVQARTNTIKDVWAQVDRVLRQESGGADDDAADPAPADLGPTDAELREREILRLREIAGDLVECPDILERAYQDGQTYMGVVGERDIYIGTLLAALSPGLSTDCRSVVSLIVMGQSSSGKSFTSQCALNLLPEDCVVQITSASNRALNYLEQDRLAHKALVFFEINALEDENNPMVCALRTLLTEGRITHWTTEKMEDDFGNVRMQDVEKKVEGPTALITTTTKTDSKLNVEMRTRVLLLETDDSSAQTRAILDADDDLKSLPEDIQEKWQAFFALVIAESQAVTIPYWRSLMALVSDRFVRIRRDKGRIRSLIRISALLHRYHRQVDAEGRIVATLDDYALARRLVLPSLEKDAGVCSDTGVVELMKYLDGRVQEQRRENEAAGPGRQVHFEPDEIRVSVRDLAKGVKASTTTLFRRLGKLYSSGVITNLETIKGHPLRLQVIGSLESLDLMPTASVLRDADWLGAVPKADDDERAEDMEDEA